jgi:hypothetical protein
MGIELVGTAVVVGPLPLPPVSVAVTGQTVTYKSLVEVAVTTETVLERYGQSVLVSGQTVTVEVTSKVVLTVLVVTSPV